MSPFFISLIRQGRLLVGYVFDIHGNHLFFLFLFTIIIIA